MANLFLDICLSDIPKDKIKEANNGKKYIKLIVGEMRQKDERGNDHYVKVFVPKAEQREGDKPIYIGKGKESENRGGAKPAAHKDDLPF